MDRKSLKRLPTPKGHEQSMALLANDSHYLSAHYAHVMEPDFDIVSARAEKRQRARRANTRPVSQSWFVPLDAPLWSQTSAQRSSSFLGTCDGASWHKNLSSSPTERGTNIWVLVFKIHASFNILNSVYSLFDPRCQPIVLITTYSSRSAGLAYSRSIRSYCIFPNNYQAKSLLSLKRNVKVFSSLCSVHTSLPSEFWPLSVTALEQSTDIFLRAHSGFWDAFIYRKVVSFYCALQN